MYPFELDVHQHCLVARSPVSTRFPVFSLQLNILDLRFIILYLIIIITAYKGSSCVCMWTKCIIIVSNRSTQELLSSVCELKLLKSTWLLKRIQWL